MFIAAVLLTAAHAHASDGSADNPGTPVPVFGQGVHEPLIERVYQAQSREFAGVLQSLDEFMAAHPDDMEVAVERCRFIEHFASLEDGAIEVATERSETCTEALEQSNLSDTPSVELYLLDHQWGDEAKKRGVALLPASKDWTAEQRARLYERLANLYASTDVIKAGGYASAAIRLDSGSNARLIAAEYLIRIGAKKAALRTIEAMPSKNWTPWELATAVKLLVGMEATDAANRLVESNPTVTLDLGTRVLLARSLFAVGANDNAKRLVKAASEEATGQEVIALSVLRELFELERDIGTTAEAAAAYRRLRDRGYNADPFARHRLSLSLHHPLARWQLEDVLGVGALLLVAGVWALLPLVIVIPIHYRSVVKRLRGQPLAPAVPSAPWSLGHMWYALAVLSVSGIGAFYFLDYPTFHLITAVPLGLDDQYDVLSSERALGNAMLVSSGVALVSLLPLLRRVDLRSLFLGQWSVRRSLLIGVGAAIGIVILNAILRVTLNKAFHGAVLGTDTTRSLQGIQATYGITAMFLFVAGLVPLIEEFVFRGVLLRTMSRYVAFWAAIIVQAGIFMIWHEDTTGWPYIVAIAVVTAWLAKRSGGLLAPMTLHAVNNAFVALTLVGLSQVFEHMN